jgi:hypothetical protein
MLKVQTHYESSPPDTAPQSAPEGVKGDTPKAMSVVMRADTLAKLDELAQRSGMKRHRYAIMILEQAAQKDIVLRQQLVMSEGLVGSVVSELR